MPATGRWTLAPAAARASPSATTAVSESALRLIPPAVRLMSATSVPYGSEYEHRSG
jgi:hypothetical protein